MNDPRPENERHLSLCLWCDLSENCTQWDYERKDECVMFRERAKEEEI